jgi:hypothetical protein
MCANPSFWYEFRDSSFEIIEKAFSTELQVNSWDDTESTEQAANHPLAATFQLKVPDQETGSTFGDVYAIVTSISFHLSSTEGERSPLRLNAGMYPSNTRAIAVFDEDDTQRSVAQRVRQIHVALSRRSAKDKSWREAMVKLMTSTDASHRPSVLNGETL